MRIYIIRHGQTEWNVSQRWQGNTDISLDDEGIGQARLIAKRLSGLGITRIYSSSLDRAAATARIIKNRIGAALELRDDLREIRLGEWEGLTYDEILEMYGNQFSEWSSSAEAQIGLGVENYRSLQQRACCALMDICTAENESVLLVTHAAWIHALMCKLLHISLDNRMCFEIGNTSLNIVECDKTDNSFRVISLNDVSHLCKSL